MIEQHRRSARRLRLRRKLVLQRELSVTELLLVVPNREHARLFGANRTDFSSRPLAPDGPLKLGCCQMRVPYLLQLLIPKSLQLLACIAAA